MEAQKLRIQVALARAALKTAYETRNRPLHFDVVVQAYLHCKRVAGTKSPYDDLIDRLEDLELQLEDITHDYVLPRWRARRMYMGELLEKGDVFEASMERASAFLALIDARLAVDQSQSSHVPKEHSYVHGMLHPAILKSSWAQFQSGLLRDAVLNAFVALGDLIRERTGLHQDGKALVEQALSLANPKLVLSDIDTDSGRNDQNGFMMIMSGAFIGIRNPKAHSLLHDLDTQKTVEYLVLASLLARRISEAKHFISP